MRYNFISADIIIYLKRRMSRKLQQKDVDAINKLRTILKEESSNSANTAEDDTVFETGSLDDFSHGLLKGERLVDIKISDYEIVAPPGEVKEYAVYWLEISTIDISYKISRRFSQFYNLYKKIKKEANITSPFPKKVYNPFLSSTHKTVLEDRAYKFQAFLKEVFSFVKMTKEPCVSSIFLKFLALRENYQTKKLIFSNKKCNSQNLAYYRMLSMKPSHSEGLKSNPFESSSLQFKLILLNQNVNGEKCLKEIDEVIKLKKNKISIEDIKVLFLGFEDSKGVLSYSLTNQSQINRIKALELLFDLLSPEKNFLFQKFEKIIEKITVEDWKVEQIHYFDSAIFKTLYFKLLNMYIEKREKSCRENQSSILEGVFQYHQELYDDYYQWKKIIKNESRQNFPQTTKNPIQNLNIDADNKEKCPKNINFLSLSFQQQPLRMGFLSHQENSIAFYFEVDKILVENTDFFLSWSSICSEIKVDQYTNIAKCKRMIGEKSINVRAKRFNFIEKAEILEKYGHLHEKLQGISELHSIFEDWDFAYGIDEYPFDFESEYEQLIFCKNYKNTIKAVIATRFSPNLIRSPQNLDQISKTFQRDIKTLTQI